MSDEPYREAGLACPTCRTGLRAFQQRLVCDSCHGMFLTVADFTQAIFDVGGGTLQITDDTATQRACPRCTQLMRACRIQAGTQSLDHDFVHCVRDGLWLDGGILEDVFERLGRKSHAGGSHNARGYSGVNVGSGASAMGAHGLGVAMAAVDAAFAHPAGGGLAVSRWWDRPPKPRVHLAFASALKSDPLGCPVCRQALELHGSLWGCHDGHGVFVENPALEAMVVEMTSQPWAMPAIHGTPGPRACPECHEPLLVDVLEGQTIDRCAEHGTWFDPTELEATLTHASDASHHSLRRWLRGLFFTP